MRFDSRHRIINQCVVARRRAPTADMDTPRASREDWEATLAAARAGEITLSKCQAKKLAKKEAAKEARRAHVAERARERGETPRDPSASKPKRERAPGDAPANGEDDDEYYARKRMENVDESWFVDESEDEDFVATGASLDHVPGVQPMVDLAAGCEPSPILFRAGPCATMAMIGQVEYVTRNVWPNGDAVEDPVDGKLSLPHVRNPWTVPHHVVPPAFDAEFASARPVGHARDERAVGCGCEGPTCDPNICACCRNADGLPAYNADGKLRVGVAGWDDRERHQFAFFRECGAACGCGPECVNKHTRKGVRVKLVVQKCRRNGYGFGVFANEKIERGTFVCEYAGEGIDAAAAAKRLRIVDENNSSNYVLVSRMGTAGGGDGGGGDDDDEGDEAANEVKWAIDPIRRGNVGRFLNHACDGGNLRPMTLGPAPARIAFFASEDIERGEELRWKYGEPKKFARKTKRGTECKCGTDACLGRMPFDVDALRTPKRAAAEAAAAAAAAAAADDDESERNPEDDDDEEDDSEPEDDELVYETLARYLVRHNK